MGPRAASRTGAALVGSRRREGNLGRRAFIVSATLWAVCLPAAVYAASLVHAGSVRRYFALSVYAIGSIVCHQRPERSFHSWNVQWPVCARCTGLYLGAAMMCLCAPLISLVRPQVDTLRGSTIRTGLLLAAFPTAATLAYEWGTGDMPSNVMRAATGALLGAAIAAVLLSAVTDRVN